MTAIAVVSTISSTFPACPQTIAKPARRPRPGSMTMSRRSAIPLLGLQYRCHHGRSVYLQRRPSRQYASLIAGTLHGGEDSATVLGRDLAEHGRAVALERPPHALENRPLSSLRIDLDDVDGSVDDIVEAPRLH